MPLRMAGGLHHLFLTGAAPELGAIYARRTDRSGRRSTQLVLGVVAQVRRAAAAVARWAAADQRGGRAASIMAGLLWLAQRLGPRFELNEIGASAGVNTMMERYFFDLGGTRVGRRSFADADRARMARLCRRRPRSWRSLQSEARISLRSICPIAAQALRLKSYVWPEATERMQRIDAAIALAGKQPPDLVRADAGEWVPRILALPQEEGVTRVLYHSIMWQYMPISTRESIVAAMEAAGEKATGERPLAWIQLETNRVTFNHELAVRFWPDPDALGWVTLATAHPHGAWVEWLGKD